MKFSHPVQIPAVAPSLAPTRSTSVIKGAAQQGSLGIERNLWTPRNTEPPTSTSRKPRLPRVGVWLLLKWAKLVLALLITVRLLFSQPFWHGDCFAECLWHGMMGESYACAWVLCTCFPAFLLGHSRAFIKTWQLSHSDLCTGGREYTSKISRIRPNHSVCSTGIYLQY